MISGRWRAWTGLAALGLGFYLLLLIATLPATWLASALERYGGGIVVLRHPHGTVWSGSARLMAITGGEAQDITSVTWRVQPLWLIVGRLRISLTGESTEVLRAQIDLTPHSLTVNDSAFELPASLIPMFYAPAALLSPAGRVQAQSAQLAISPGRIDGEASLRWSGARMGSALSREMGDYQVNVRGLGPQAEIDLSTLRGDLRLEARGSWAVSQNGGVLQVRGTAGLAAARPDLEPLLAMLGAADSNGRRSFSISAPMPPSR